MLNRLYRTLSATALIAAGCLATSAHADSVAHFASGSGGSMSGMGGFEGEMAYKVKAGKDFGTLLLNITNTNNPSNGGALTGIVFNINSADAGANAKLAKNASHAFSNLSGSDLNADPFGNGFSAGIAVGNKWSGGGAVSKGIAAGDTGTFKFKINASDFASLTASSFLNGPFTNNFVARFRGFDEGPNDKVFASVAHMPLPAPLLLGLAGLAAVFGLRRRLASAH